MEQYISLILNAILGGGFIASLVNLRSTKKKAASEAKSKELDNVQEAIGIWREMAEGLKKELEETRAENADFSSKMQKEIETLRKAVCRLTTVNNKMVKLLDKITPANLEEMVTQIKMIHDEN
jgi:predicted  nucleic acid-binding Zn-ribbon protein